MNADRIQHAGPRARRIAVVALLGAVILLFFRGLAPDPDEALIAFDAAHAVPDEDNAAILYAELLQGEQVPLSDLTVRLASATAAMQAPVSVREMLTSRRELRELVPPEGMDPNLIWSAASRSWKSAEHPELQLWLDMHRHRIEGMLEVAQKPSCRFPLSPAPGQMGLLDVPLGAFRQSVLLLRVAACNDLGEGDVGAALAKWRALMAMGRHFRSQPSPWHLLTGIAGEAAALDRFKEFVVEGLPGDPHLQDIAHECEKVDRPWELLRRDINRARDLSSRILEDHRSLKSCIYMKCRRICYGERGWLEDRSCELYHRMLSDRRGVRILVELRRFKDRTGRWPESLDQIAGTLPPGILIDPISGGSYVFRPLENGFLLYSVGPNRIDENGQHKSSGPDDWPIWPPRGRSSEPEPEK